MIPRIISPICDAVINECSTPILNSRLCTGSNAACRSWYQTTGVGTSLYFLTGASVTDLSICCRILSCVRSTGHIQSHFTKTAIGTQLREDGQLFPGKDNLTVQRSVRGHIIRFWRINSEILGCEGCETCEGDWQPHFQRKTCMKSLWRLRKL